MGTYHIRGHYFVISVTTRHCRETDSLKESRAQRDFRYRHRCCWRASPLGYYVMPSVSSYQNFVKFYYPRLRAKYPRTTRCNIPEVLEFQYKRFFPSHPQSNQDFHNSPIRMMCRLSPFFKRQLRKCKQSAHFVILNILYVTKEIMWRKVCHFSLQHPFEIIFARIIYNLRRRSSRKLCMFSCQLFVSEFNQNQNDKNVSDLPTSNYMIFRFVALQ